MTLPRLHVVTDDEVVAKDSWLDRAAGVMEACGAGVALHVRAPHTAGRRIYEWCHVLRPEAQRTGATLLVNDRVDVARALGLGVHLGRRSLPCSDARSLLLAGLPVGVSCHRVEEVEAARADGAEYAFFGNVFETGSHPGRPGAGPEGLRAVVGHIAAFPIIAIGGVSPDRVAETIEAGARGVAVLQGIWGSDDSRAAAVEYISALGNVEERR